MSFSCQGTARYHSMSWHFLILVLALFDRKVKMQPGINSENMIHSLWVGWATTLHIGFEILNWFKIPMMVVNRVSSKTYWDRAIFFVFSPCLRDQSTLNFFCSIYCNGTALHWSIFKDFNECGWIKSIIFSTKIFKFGNRELQH